MNLVDATRWAASGLLAFCAAFLIFVQPVIEVFEIRRIVRAKQDRCVTSVLVVGTLCGMLAMAIAPIGTFSDRLKWIWVPFAAEATMFVAAALAVECSGLGRKLRSLWGTRKPPDGSA